MRDENVQRGAWYSHSFLKCTTIEEDISPTLEKEIFCEEKEEREREYLHYWCKESEKKHTLVFKGDNKRAEADVDGGGGW